MRCVAKVDHGLVDDTTMDRPPLDLDRPFGEDHVVPPSADEVAKLWAEVMVNFVRLVMW